MNLFAKNNHNTVLSDFPDFGGPRITSRTGTPGRGGVWETYFSGLALNCSLAVDEDIK